MVELPSVISCLFCDHVYRCPTTNKMSILGTWTHLNASALPFTMYPFSVFLALRNGRGRVPIRLELLTGDEQTTLQFFETEIELPDPMAIREVGFGVPATQFPMAGVYRLNIWTGKDLLASRRLPVMLR